MRHLKYFVPLVVALLPIEARAQSNAAIVGPVSISVTSSSNGPSTPLPLSAGQSSCAVKVTGNGSGFAYAPAYSPDGGTTYINIPAYNVVTGALVTAITANGTYSVAVGQYGGTAFAINYVANPSGSTTNAVTYVCSSGNSSAIQGFGLPGSPVAGVQSVQTPNVAGGGALAGNGQTVVEGIASGQSTCGAYLNPVGVMTYVFETSYDGVNYVQDNGVGAFGTASGAGNYSGTCFGNYFRVRVNNYTSGSTTVVLFASTAPGGYAAFQNSTGGASAVAADKSARVTFAAAGTYIPVTAVGTTTLIYITGFGISILGTTPAFQFGYAVTGTSCGSFTGVTGQIPLSSGFFANAGGGIGLLLPPIPAGNDLCLVITGSGISGGGFISYAQH